MAAKTIEEQPHNIHAPTVDLSVAKKSPLPTVGTVGLPALACEVPRAHAVAVLGEELTRRVLDGSGKKLAST